MLFNGFHPFRTTCHIENAFELVKRLFRNLSEDAWAISFVIASETGVAVFVMLGMSFPYRSGLYVILPFECVRIDAIAVIEDVVRHYFCKRVELAALF